MIDINKIDEELLEIAYRLGDRNETDMEEGYYLSPCGTKIFCHYSASLLGARRGIIIGVELGDFENLITDTPPEGYELFSMTRAMARIKPEMAWRLKLL